MPKQLGEGAALQPTPKVIQNPPAPTVAQALANCKQQVEQAGK